MDKILKKALTEPVQGELFSYAEFGNNWDKKFGKGEFARFEKKWNKRFGSTITLDHQLKQKATDQPDFFDKLEISEHAKDKSWENTEGWNTLFNKENEI